MLRLSLWILAILLVAGQIFADDVVVSVYVDMKQTGPVNSSEIVQARVGKNVNATYSATANYNGNPVLHAEESLQSTQWTYTVSAGSDVIYSPSSGNGSSVTMTAKSTEAGTYTMTATFDVTFTIKTPQKDSNGNYVYSNGVQQFTTRTDGPYTGSGSATLNVKDGKFEVKIKPSVLIPQYSGDTNGYRNKLGIGEETATILVFPEEDSEDTVVFYTATSSDFSVSGASFDAGAFAKQGTISVYANINGNPEPDGPETIGVTIVEPGGAGMVNLQKKPHPNPPQNPGDAYAPFVGMETKAYFLPNDVSFSRVEIQEGNIPSSREGYFKQLYPNGYDHPEGDWFGISHNPIGPYYNEDIATDNVGGGPFYQPPTFEDGSYFQWDIPWFYRVVGHAKSLDKYFILTHYATMDKDGNMEISKGGATESTPPY
ncbi:MAG: hypothetical protein LBJ67_11700 [Planctomycetaceae bacterium]|jgi:hypothetical protein|nr:hypothetical protein [Planctomycetaceae bacterium]